MILCNYEAMLWSNILLTISYLISIVSLGKQIISLRFYLESINSAQLNQKDIWMEGFQNTVDSLYDNFLDDTCISIIVIDINKCIWKNNFS